MGRNMPAVKASSARAGRLEKLVARWRELAEAGYRHNSSHRTGWAEHIERLSAQPGAHNGDATNGSNSHPPEDVYSERQLEQGSLSAQGLAPLVTILSRRQ